MAISRGGASVVLGRDHRFVEAYPPQVKVSSPVGAGDAMMAGIVWANTRGLSLVETARWAVASGIAAAAQDGTGVGTSEQIAELAPQVKVREIRDCDVKHT